MKEAPPSDKSPLRLNPQLSWRLTAPEQWPVVSRTAKCGFAVKDLPGVSEELGVTNNVFSSIQSTSDRPHQGTEGCYSHCWGDCYLWLRTLLWGHNCGMVPRGYKAGTKRQGKFKVYTGLWCQHQCSQSDWHMVLESAVYEGFSCLIESVNIPLLWLVPINGWCLWISRCIEYFYVLATLLLLFVNGIGE